MDEGPSSTFQVATDSDANLLQVVARLWFAGFADALSFRRAAAFCSRSRVVFVKTCQCFLLNGCIFLGSIYFLQSVVIPTLDWLLRLSSLGDAAPTTFGLFLDVLRLVLIGLCYVFWLYPLYIISFVINCIWYNEIARHAFEVIEQNGAPKLSDSSPQASLKSSKGTLARNQGDLGSFARIMLGISEQIYSIIMVSTFFVEVFVVNYIPYVGRPLYFVLLSWLYAYYCFDYKWGFARWSLEKRLAFFESNWAFFAGFGSPCVLATSFFSPFVGAGVMAVLFPLFVLIATASDPEELVRRVPGNQRLPRLEIFLLANYVTLPILRLFQPSSRTSQRQAQERQKRSHGMGLHQ